MTTPVNRYDLRFAQELVKLIEDELKAHHTRAFNGSMVKVNDPAATGMAYAMANGHYAGLQLALTHIDLLYKRLFTAKAAPDRDGHIVVPRN